MAEIAEIEEEITDEFSLFSDWMEKYDHLISLGKTLPLIDEAHKTEDNLVKGCQSKVWLYAEMKDNKVHYTADSDAVITKGMIALLIRVLGDQAPGDVVNAKLEFIDNIGLKEHLSPTRSNGLVSMIKQMKLFALAFQATRKS